MIGIGSHVRVLAPFDGGMPGVYRVVADRGGGTFSIFDGRDFAAQYLEETQAAVTHEPGLVVTENATRISKAQAKKWLKDAGFLAAVQAALEQFPADHDIRIFWEDEAYFDIDSPALMLLATQVLGLNAEQLQAAFNQAAQGRV